MRQGVDVPIVGRDRELEALREGIARASFSRALLVIEGEAGIGKTRLLREASRIARDCGFNVFAADAHELEQARPYGLLLATVESRADADGSHLRDLVAHPQQGDADRRLAVIDWFTSFIESAAEAAPVALMLDDLHWADDETLQVLRAVVRRSTSFPLAIVAASRPAPSRRELEELVFAIEDHGIRIALDPLDEASVGQLVDRLIAESVTPDLLARAATARGNPFFVIEILAGGLRGDASETLPKDLRRTVLRRLMHLSDDAQAMLRVAALMGATIDPAELAAVLGRSAIDLVPMLDEAIKGGVLEERDAALVFRHDIVREAVYRDLPAPVRRTSHRDVARTLAAAGAPAARVAMHLARAARPGDGEAVSWLRRAAAEEIQRAPTAAADMLGQAAELVDPHESLHGEIQAERVQALAWAGRVTEASALATDVLSGLRDAEVAADVRASLGESLLFRGYVVDAAAQFEVAAAAAARPQRPLLLAEAAACRMVSGSVGPASGLAARALTEVDVSDDPRARSLALGVSGMLAILSGDGTGLELTREAVRIADADFLGESHRYLARVFLGYALHEADQHDAAIDVLREGLRLDEARGVSWGLPCYHALLGLVHFRRAEWDDAIAELETAKAVCDDMGSTFMAPMAHGLLAQIAVFREDHVTAERELLAGETKIATTGMQYGAENLAQTRAWLADSAGDTSTARDTTRAIWDVAESLGVQLVYGWTAPDYVRLCIASDDHAEAERVVQVVDDLASSMRSPSLQGTALHCRGMLTSDRPTLLDAVERLREGGRPLKLADGCEAAAAAVERDGDAAERSNELLSEAIAIWESVGAVRELRRVSQAFGQGSQRRRPTKRRPVSGWQSLSPTERRVVALVAEGLTNPAIAEELVVSRRTVETHVSHLFRKLGVTSRVELVLLASKELAKEIR